MVILAFMVDIHLFMIQWVVGSIPHGRLIFFPTSAPKTVVCAILSGMVHINDPLLLIGKSSLCGCSVYYLQLSEWSLPYVRRYLTVNVLSVSLNKPFPSV